MIGNTPLGEPSPRTLRIFLVVAVAAGVFLRLFVYLSNRSFWMDEAHVALRIIGPRFWQILFHGDYVQTMPIGMAIVQRFMVEIFGPGELALRAIPFFAGIGSLLLVGVVARRILSPLAVPIAVALFAVSRSLVNYSAEAKQYSADVLWALVLYACWLNVSIGRFHPREPRWMALIGSIAIWCSHPSVFVLAGIGIVLCAACIAARDWKGLIRYGWVIAAWTASFTLLSHFSLVRLVTANSLIRDWGRKGSFMPVREGIGSIADWLVERFWEIFLVINGDRLMSAMVILFMIGCYAIYDRRRPALAALVLPLLFAAAAASLKVYAFRDRLLLFLAPAVMLLIAQGLAVVTASVSRNLASAIFALIFTSAVIWVPNSLSINTEREDLRSVMRYVGQRFEEDDLVYVYYGAIPAFTYYFQTRGFAIKRENVIIGASARNDPERYLSELPVIARGRERVWVLFSHIYPDTDDDNLLRRLDLAGRRRDFLPKTGAAVYLYDFSEGGKRVGES